MGITGTYRALKMSLYNELTLMYPAGGVPDERFDYKTWLFAATGHCAEGELLLISKHDGRLFYTAA